ncbi:MAG: hypothetical protein RLZZ528_2302, partial [Pseudomonadota bacterium]
MVFPERFSNLPDYAFPRLRKLLDHHAPGGPAGDVITMTIGEPQHAIPAFVGPVLAAHLDEFGKYPPNEGSPRLLAAISGWLKRRYGADIAPDRIMALNGTREGLFDACLALCPETKNGKRPVVLMPNPFYQVYAAAALSVGAEPVYVPATAATGFLPDYAALPADILDRTAIAYLCSPANPQGSVASEGYLADLLALAARHGFTLLSDECYSEIWRSAPPPGALQVAARVGTDPEQVAVFHSLSKRSNLPGLRSGFVAGGPLVIERFRQLRSYGGAPLPLPVQRVSEMAWADETHVDDNRALYQDKFRIADQVFGGM